MRATVTKLAHPSTRQIRHLRTHQRIYRVVLEGRLHTRLRGNGGSIQTVRGDVSLLDHAASSIIRISARTQRVHKLSAQTISIVCVGQLIAASLVHVRGTERLRNLGTKLTALTHQTAQAVIRLDRYHGSTKRINAPEDDEEGAHGGGFSFRVVGEYPEARHPQAAYLLQGYPGVRIILDHALWRVMLLNPRGSTV